VQGGFEAEWPADGLTYLRRSQHRGRWNVPARRRSTDRLRNRSCQLGDRRIARPAEYVGLSERGGMLAAADDPRDEVVDVGHVIEHCAVADHAERAARDGAKELVKAQIAWPVDAHRPKDRARQSGVEVLARQLLARQFALLIDIERTERS